MTIDKQDMASVLRDFPTQIKEALTLSQGIKAPGNFDKILVCGMGGSAIGGDILKAYMMDKKIPVYVNKDYDIPEFVDKNTLVFAVSYSGNTEETLSALTQAKNKGAKIVAITSGGQLSDVADKVIKIPSGLQPRNGVAYLFFPMIGVLFNSGVIEVKNSELNELLKVVSNVDSFDEKGRQLAMKIKSKTPIIYSTPRMEPAAYRFKCEINENSKHPAYHHTFPELCHNELVGFSGMERSKFVIIMIKDSFDHERNKKRMEICKSLFSETVDVEEINTTGTSYLARLFSAIYLGDWISYHLAVWKRVDPTPVYVIEDLKKALKK